VSLPPWHEEAIARPHNRKRFDCGDVGMNEFLQRFARQGHEQNAVKTFCAIADDAPDRVLGFYSLAPASVEHDSVPAAMTKGLARHNVPGFLLARLAVDKSVAGRGRGGQLLLAAALRCIRVTGEVGGVLMIIDAKNERAAQWYVSYGAEALRDRPLTLAAPLATFAATLRASGHL
jgi:GNAT superfamily N-acetyltransferase